ncbi:protein abrupt-like isoform X1 [Onthophagus taurus]|uniref:protein abrupt-like isoform X1 n=1 Tax=Onthophagus taurus TaxID=166361 RepID=UPI000C200426|nr:protein abrupt-like isoform X1 [Onthophagus taurus]
MSIADEQQFCLRWNNFQANITSQFEALRDDEDFTDVTIACDGQRLQAHKVVLSACSPFFKELFKTNPCPHPIIFMRDVEARHIVALMEFMYAGEVNVAQAQLSAFLKTAESLKIRGLTDTSSSEPYKERDDDTVYLNPKPSSSKHGPSFPLKHSRIAHKSHISSSSSSTVTSSQDVPANNNNNINKIGSPPPSKRQCKNERIESDLQRLKELSTFNEEAISVNPFSLQEDVERNGVVGDGIETKSPGVIPKVELPDYISDEEKDENSDFYQHSPNAADLTGGMEIIPQANAHSSKDNSVDVNTGTLKIHRRRTSDSWSPYVYRFNDTSPVYQQDATSTDFTDTQSSSSTRNRLVKLGEGIEICEDQLRSVKWSDYRKLTRGLATILFSPAELATCSVTGQRWSRAGNDERPVKPALDRKKVQAIISYVATRFPMVEVSRIKQVLAYKCKENSTALRMKSVRYYSDPPREVDK